MNFKKLICSVLMLAALCAAPLAASAAPVTAVRSSVSPARVRLVFDSREPVKYTAEKNGLQLVVTLPEGTALTQKPVFKQDAVIKNITVPAKKKKKAQVVIDLTKDCQYKLYNLKNPDRLVLDIYRIPISKTTTQLAGGVTYTYAQEELNGRPLVSYLVSVAPSARLELRPFSAAGMYNGRGSLAKQAAQRGLLAAVNASYFDTDGWVIGNVKDKGNFVAMD
ncbi:AMIN domain-containing protein, partial [Phascolarctobacterium succinatutens]|uniref:AMIN domain-containing protein n=1 Tax=Phascolarctobacterium succinatutens TaxID=626940 RepID=UPI004027A6C1